MKRAKNITGSAKSPSKTIVFCNLYCTAYFQLTVVLYLFVLNSRKMVHKWRDVENANHIGNYKKYGCELSAINVSIATIRYRMTTYLCGVYTSVASMHCNLSLSTTK